MKVRAEQVGMVEKLESRRMLSAGDQDLSFGTNGFVKLHFGDSAYQFLPGSDPLGKATTVSLSATGRSFTIQRFDRGVAGKKLATLPLPFVPPVKGDIATPGRVWSMPDGKTLIEFKARGQFDDPDSYLVRLNPGWTLDETYGTGGVMRFATGFRADVVQQGDKFLVTEENGQDNFVRRITQEGETDETFGTKGFLTLKTEAPSISNVAPDGKILLLTDSFSQTNLYRLLPDGQRDNTFGGGDGITSFVASGLSTAAVVDAKGRIVLGGTSVVRFNPDGTLDTSFGKGGVSELFQGRTTEQDGEVLVGSSTLIAPNGAGYLVHVDENGNYDATFGRVEISLFFLTERGSFFEEQHARVESDGSVTVWGQYTNGLLIATRIQAGGNVPGPVQRLGDGTISVTGTSGNDDIYFTTEYYWGTALLNGIGRSYFPEDIGRFAASAGAENDVIHGEWLGTIRAAQFSGGEVNDSIVGTDKSDTLIGNAGSDTIIGGSGADFIRGNGGRDHLYGSGGNDRIYGGDAGDWIYGQVGNDQLFGDGGTDRIYSDDEGGDTIHGGGGNDLLVTRDSTTDVLFGDAGRDSALADKRDVLSSVEVQP
jgi:uncharacterized delta-60 repeat protein